MILTRAIIICLEECVLPEVLYKLPMIYALKMMIFPAVIQITLQNIERLFFIFFFDSRL